MAFFPLFVDPARHQGLLTFGVMALTVAVLTFLYGALAVAITKVFAERLRASPTATRWLNRLAGTLLLGFGIKLALSR
jgi:threonine/homoserine/homoserine lactone efflux protein